MSEYWPQRLIHIPTMALVKRYNESIYLLWPDHKIKEPEYSTLSYTWGRWRIKGEEAATSDALPVKGTLWPILP